MYIIYNSDGSIEKKSITEYIQQGNSYANVLFVTVKDTDLGDYTASAIVTLPNGQNVGAIIEEAEEPVEIDGIEYNGYYITLDETCTLMAGAIRISLSLTIEETRVVTYPIYLNVNATPYDADAPVMISYNQYLELLASIAEVTTPNNPTITLQKNGVTVGYFSLNQASNKTINYVLSKSDVGLGNVDNTSDATKKSNFTGSIANGNTGFVTGGDVYNYCYSKNAYESIKASQLKLKTTGGSDITFENYNGVLTFLSYAFSNSSIRYLVDNTCDLGSSEYKFKDLYLAGNAYANEYYIGGGTYSSLGREYGNTYIKTFNNNVTTKYYFATTYFSPNNTNAQDLGNDSYKWKDLYLAGKINKYYVISDSGFYYENATPIDLGTSTYPWKDLYLSGNVNIGGKINELTVPNSTKFPQQKGTIALKEDMSPIIIEAGVTPTKIKNYSQETPADTHKIYLAGATTWTDITSEYQNGDYDSLTLANSAFNSSNKEVSLANLSSDYIAFRIASVNGYFISQAYKLTSQIMSWAGRTIVVIDDGLPNRVCIGSICYKC